MAVHRTAKKQKRQVPARKPGQMKGKRTVQSNAKDAVQKKAIRAGQKNGKNAKNSARKKARLTHPKPLKKAAHAKKAAAKAAIKAAIPAKHKSHLESKPKPESHLEFHAKPESHAKGPEKHAKGMGIMKGLSRFRMHRKKFQLEIRERQPEGGKQEKRRSGLEELLRELEKGRHEKPAKKSKDDGLQAKPGVPEIASDAREDAKPISPGSSPGPASSGKKLSPIKFRPLKDEEKTIFSAQDIKILDLQTASEAVEKMRTGVEGLDQLFTEGLPKGASILVEGGPGSGKTIFCLQVAHNVCKNGGKAFYMSFEEPEMRLISHMKNFGWEPEKYIRSNQLLIKRYSAIDISRSVEALLSAAKKELLIEVRPVFFPEGFKPNIVIIDSLTSIASAFSGESSRFRVYMEQLFKYLETENITSFLIRETPSPAHIGKSYTGRESAVSFLSDGIISIYNVILPSGERTGGIEIVKMRGEKFSKRIVRMDITDKGMAVYPDDRIEVSNVIT